MAAQFFEIPLLPSTDQTLSVPLPNGTYQLTLHWVDTGLQNWLMDIADSDGNDLVSGIPLVTGADLLAQYPDLNFGGEMWVWTDVQPYATPTFDNLGVSSHLYFVIGGSLTYDFTNGAP